MKAARFHMIGDGEDIKELASLLTSNVGSHINGRAIAVGDGARIV